MKLTCNNLPNDLSGLILPAMTTHGPNTPPSTNATPSLKSVTPPSTSGTPYPENGTPPSKSGTPPSAKGTPFVANGTPPFTKGTPFVANGVPFVSNGVPFFANGVPFFTNGVPENSLETPFSLDLSTFSCAPLPYPPNAKQKNKKTTKTYVKSKTKPRRTQHQ